MTLWSIWHYRNDKLWNEVDRSATINLSLASDLLQQWQLARPQLHPMNTDEANLRWTRPPAGSMKCNVDAAIFKEINKIGGAVIIRDSAGEFMMCRSYSHRGLFEVREAEAKALLEALSWAASLDLQQVIFETDSKSVAEAINSNHVDRSEFGTIITECCYIISREPNYKVHFVRRQANVVAHILAKATTSYASPHTFYEALLFMSELLISDCNNSSLN